MEKSQKHTNKPYLLLTAEQDPPLGILQQLEWVLIAFPEVMNYKDEKLVLAL